MAFEGTTLRIVRAGRGQNRDDTPIRRFIAINNLEEIAERIYGAHLPRIAMSATAKRVLKYEEPNQVRPTTVFLRNGECVMMRRAGQELFIMFEHVVILEFRLVHLIAVLRNNGSFPPAIHFPHSLSFFPSDTLPTRIPSSFISSVAVSSK